MEETLKLVLAVAVLITAAKSAGYLSTRAGQPAVLGELLIGVILGPSLLNMFGWAPFHSEHLPETIRQFAEIGVILLMFIAGLEIELDELLRAGKTSTFAGIMGVALPLAAGLLVALLFGYSFSRALFVGIILTATSVSISAQTLLELGELRSRPGIALLGAAVVDDVLVILILSLFLALSSGGGGPAQILLILLQMTLYLAGAIIIGNWLIPRLTRWVVRRRISQGLTALAIVVTLLLSWSAEALGHVAMITGAVIAGVLFGRTPYKERIEHGIEPITYGLFVPIFFINIGLQANLRVLDSSTLLFALIIVIVAVLSKIIGCGFGALLSGMPRRDSFLVGLGMVSRGEVGLIVATVGIINGVIGNEVYATAVLMVLATTLLTPLLLKWAFSSAPASKAVPTPQTPSPDVE